jgi:hypothetical protein
VAKRGANSTTCVASLSTMAALAHPRRVPLTMNTAIEAVLETGGSMA